MFSRSMAPQTSRAGCWSRLKERLFPSLRRPSQSQVPQTTSSGPKSGDWREYYGGELPCDPFACYEPVTIVIGKRTHSRPAPFQKDISRGSVPLNLLDVPPLLQRQVSKPLPVLPPVRCGKVNKRELKPQVIYDSVPRTSKKAKPQDKYHFGYLPSKEKLEEKLIYGYAPSRQEKLRKKLDHDHIFSSMTAPEHLSSSYKQIVSSLECKLSKKKEGMVEREPSYSSTRSTISDDGTFYTCLTTAEEEISASMRKTEEAMFMQARPAYLAKTKATQSVARSSPPIRQQDRGHSRHWYATEQKMRDKETMKTHLLRSSNDVGQYTSPGGILHDSIRPSRKIQPSHYAYNRTSKMVKPQRI